MLSIGERSVQQYLPSSHCEYRVARAVRIQADHTLGSSSTYYIRLSMSPRYVSLVLPSDLTDC